MPAERRSSLSSKDNDTTRRRTYQACTACRKAKLRCDLGNVDAPHAPPCRRCLRTQRECVFDVIYGRDDLNTSSARRNTSNETMSHTVWNEDSFHGENEIQQDFDAVPTQGKTLENPADALRILRAAADSDESAAEDTQERGTRSHSQSPAWERWPPIPLGLLLPEEARILLNFYESNLNPCHPLICSELFNSCNFGILLKEPILLAVMIAIAARFYTLEAEHIMLGGDRLRSIQSGLLKWLLNRIIFVAIGLTASIGIVEALLVLSEWPPEPSALVDSGILDLAQDRLSPCKLYDDVSWALTGMAVRIAQTLDLQDEKTYLDKTQPDWIVTRRYRTWTNCLSADRHASVRLSRASLMQEMSTTWYRTISGIGYLTGDTTFPLPRVHLNHREILNVVELTHIIGLLQELLYITPEVTQELIKTARFESTLHRLKPEMDSLWQRQAGDLPTYPVLDQSDQRFSPDELRQVRWRMDHDYVKLYANSIAMRASQNRLLQRHQHKNNEDRVFQANVIQSSEGSFIIEAVDAAISLIRCGVAMERKYVLKYCPNRVFLRLVFASVFLMKAMSFGAVAPPEQQIVDLQYSLIRSLKAVAVDEHHVASYLATLLERVFPAIPTEPSRPIQDDTFEGPLIPDQSTLALFGFDTDLNSEQPQDLWTDMTGFGYDPSSIISDIEEMLAASTTQPSGSDMFSSRLDPSLYSL
ncbi:uncharacterized protein L201_007417 [Kwoniella dendrophila CBS 6074]|uniref:Zn(2)-C6 fungal-type domain-containing protein n=1 Tax=Kwoniella dendrophila CBS 6074 TaxID=1295534 RepID=A0AAX4K4Y2_9TREE